jgi:N-dimethylarginine dimethylaminohydrolase
MKKVLLCPPTYFDVEYEINPWMHKEVRPDKKKSM